MKAKEEQGRVEKSMGKEGAAR